MFNNRSVQAKILASLTLTFTPAMLMAADGTSATNRFNAVLVGLISLIVVLLIAILVLGNTVKQLAFVYRDKIRNQRTNTGIKAIALLIAASISSISVNAQEAVTAIAPSLPKSIAGLSATDFYMLAGIVALEFLIIFALAFVLRKLVRLVGYQPAQEIAASVEPSKKVKVSFWDRFNKVVPIEKEKDILLDHNYDGIQELDNSLPPWWKYGFYVTIVVAFVYMWYYHAGGTGPSSYDEYVAEVENGEEEKAAYLAKTAGNVDENTVKMLDEAGIAAGQTIFQTSCAACHAKDGGGGVGPNLTDDYWLHGGSIPDIFKSIKYGWADKGMKSWKDDFSPVQIAQITSYVKSLKGTKPAAPKDKQGDLYTEDSNSPAKDTVKVLAAK